MSRIDDLRKNAPGPVVSPVDGGCWFCHRDSGDMSFTIEFDAFVHENCVTLTLEDDPLHAEALFIAREFGMIDSGEVNARIAEALGDGHDEIDSGGDTP